MLKYTAYNFKIIRMLVIQKTDKNSFKQNLKHPTT